MRSVCQSAAPYSRTYPAGPPVAAVRGYRWIRTPSISAKGSVSRPVPRGQITSTR